jgi:predicted nucleotide-binding protein
LAEALLSQPLLSGNRIAAIALSKRAKILELPKNSQFITQGGQDNDLYFILSGVVSVLVNKREIATRHAGEHVGEMSLIDLTAVRSATVITAEPCVLAKIPEAAFTQIANRHAVIWRKLAGIIAQRLRERSRFHLAPRSVPCVFIGSSSEALPVANAVHKSLSKFRVVPRIWTDGVFRASRATIEDLITETNQSDFAILVLSADDVITSRGRRKAAPRDNTIFELGLFMGALSRDRTYIIAPTPLDLKIPTDLLGITLMTYEEKRGVALAHAIRPIIRSLMSLIEKHGPM